MGPNGICFDIALDGNLFIECKLNNKTVHLKTLPQNRAFYIIFENDSVIDNGVGPLQYVLDEVNKHCILT